MAQNRRRFVQQLIGLGGIGVVGGFAGCARSSRSLDDAVDLTDDDSGTPVDAGVGLRAGMTIGMGSTAAGGLAGPSEVDPDEPGGGRLITVEAVEPGRKITFSWRQTVERTTTPDETPPTVGVGEDTPTPVVEVVEESGTITATGLDEAHEPFLPMYWQPGEIQTGTSAVWLSAEAFQELRETRQTAWSRDVLTRLSRIGVETVAQIDSAVAEEIRNGAAAVDEVYLEAEPDFVEFELVLDGQATSVEAIEAVDSFGNAYTILNDARNPLIVAFTYDAVSVGFTGFDTALWTLIKTVFSGYEVVSLSRP